MTDDTNGIDAINGFIRKLNAWYGTLTPDQLQLLDVYIARSSRINARKDVDRSRRHNYRLHRHWGPQRTTQARTRKDEPGVTE